MLITTVKAMGTITTAIAILLPETMMATRTWRSSRAWSCSRATIKCSDNGCHQRPTIGMRPQSDHQVRRSEVNTNTETATPSATATATQPRECHSIDVQWALIKCHHLTAHSTWCTNCTAIKSECYQLDPSANSNSICRLIGPL